MENKNAKSIVRRYKIEKLIIVFLFYIICFAVLILTDLNIGIEILVFLVYFFLLNKINCWLSICNFHEIIYNDLDSELFNDVINCLGKNRKISYKLGKTVKEDREKWVVCEKKELAVVENELYMKVNKK